MSSRSVKMLSNIDLIGALSFSSNPSEFIATEKPTLTIKDGVPHMCVVVGGIPVWGKIINEDAVYVHVQETASALWTITHNKESIDYAISVFDANGEVINVFTKTIDDNTVEVDFGVAVAGRAVLLFNGGSPAVSGGTSSPTQPLEPVQAFDPWSAPASSATYNYSGDLVSSVVEIVNGEERVSTYTYSDERIMSVTTTYGSQKRTVTYQSRAAGNVTNMSAVVEEL